MFFFFARPEFCITSAVCYVQRHQFKREENNLGLLGTTTLHKQGERGLPGNTNPHQKNTPTLCI